jgi:hypothetical protein
MMRGSCAVEVSGPYALFPATLAHNFGVIGGIEIGLISRIAV